MMSLKFKSVGCIALACSTLFATAIKAQEEQAPAEEAAPTEAELAREAALKGEVAFVEALIDASFPDLAQIVIAETKKAYPESAPTFFALEVRGMLQLGKYAEAEKKIASLPNRDSAEYWAARVEMALSLYSRGQKAEGEAIFEQFFKRYPKPTKELKEFYRTAAYQYGQVLTMSKKIKRATEIYSELLKLINPRVSESEGDMWAYLATELVQLYLREAEETADVRAREEFLKPANKIVDKLLWMQDRPVYFGRAIAMKAHIELLKGRVDRAQAVIDDYMDQLAEIHEQLAKAEKEGFSGALKLSPMPQCRYLLADILWKAAQDEAKKPSPNNDLIKAYLFGEKTSSGKRNGSGAFNHAINVFAQFPESPWAARAGEMSEAIRTFAEEKYNAKIKTNITPEQIERVRAMQFKEAKEKYLDKDYPAAIKAYNDALALMPESKYSVDAIENVVNALHFLRQRKKDDEAAQADYRIDIDAIEGYLSERFSGSRDNDMMIKAGDATIRLAALEKDLGDLGRADALYKAFIRNYRRHPNAALMALALGGEALKDQRYADAIALYDMLGKYYPKSEQYTAALIYKANCQRKLSDRKGAIESQKAFLTRETNDVQRLQVQAALANDYKDVGLQVFKAAETNETPELVEKQLRQGTAEIVRGIKEFSDIAKKIDSVLASPTLDKANRQKYTDLKESVLYLIPDSWMKLKKPPKNLDAYRHRAADGFEAYLAVYPHGKYAPYAYSQLATLYTIFNDLTKTQETINRLQKEFPDSQIAKNMKPRLAKSLIEMDKIKEGTDVYREMLKTDGEYTPYQFLDAGEALINAKSWELAKQAFDMAASKASTNLPSVVARARLGQAKSLFRQKAYVEAREALDELLADSKRLNMSIATDANKLVVEVAIEQGRREKDNALRTQHFNAAVDAVGKLRSYLKGHPQWEIDRVNLGSADVYRSRVEAEERMGLTDQAIESASRGAANMVGFLASRKPSEAHPIDKFLPEERENLEQCYEKLIWLLNHKGPEGAEQILRYGEEYLHYFPNGAGKTGVVNAMNAARSFGGGEGAEKAAEPTEKSAEAPVAAPAAEPVPAEIAEGSLPAATETK